MRKSLLFFAFIFISLYGYPQFSLSIDGEEAFNGDVFNFYPEENDMSFVLTNTSDSDINVACTVVSIANNSDGGDVQFCWGLCYTTILVGDVFPPGGFETVASGESTAAFGNHFENMGGGDNTDEDIVYVFKFYSQSDSGEIDIDSIKEITYVYHHTTSIEDMNHLDFSIFPTDVTSSFHIVSQEPLNGKIITTEGKTIKEFSIKEGANSIDTTVLANQLYYILLSNKSGQTGLSKIIVQH